MADPAPTSYNVATKPAEPLRPHPDSIALVEAAKTSGTLFYLRRIRCAEGREAEDQTKRQGVYARLQNGNAGEVCSMLAETSADVQVNAAALKKRPDMSLYAPYQAIISAAGFQPSLGNVTQTLNLIDNVGVDPKTANSKGPIQIPTSKKPIGVTPGLIADAAFAEAISNHITISTAGVPARQYPNMSETELNNAWDHCVAQQATFAQCRAVGAEKATIWLQKKGAASR